MHLFVIIQGHYFDMYAKDKAIPYNFLILSSLLLYNIYKVYQTPINSLNNKSDYFYCPVSYIILVSQVEHKPVDH
jgi:hypothetical protein